MGTRIEIKHWIQEGRPVAIGEVSLNGGEICVRGAQEGNTPDCEKMATLYAIQKMLSLSQSKYGKALLPLPAEKVLQLAYYLVTMRLKALQGGKKSRAAKDSKAALQTALQSPNRWVRAVAAGMQELLK